MFKINLLKRSNEFSEVWRKKLKRLCLIEGSLPYYAVVKE